jgi:hypothetical protein
MWLTHVYEEVEVSIMKHALVEKSSKVAAHRNLY